MPPAHHPATHCNPPFCDTLEHSTKQHTLQHALLHTLIERTPPPRGGFFVGWFPNQKPGGRGHTLKNNPKIDQFWGCSSGCVLFLRVLDLETAQQRNPPEGGGFFRSFSTLKFEAMHVAHCTSTLYLPRAFLLSRMKVCARRGGYMEAHTRYGLHWNDPASTDRRRNRCNRRNRCKV